MTAAARGRALHDFFLKGLPKDSIASGLPKDKIDPIVDALNYAGGPAHGQIRTNQFMAGRWTLREFKTSGGSIVPTTVKSDPGNDLFSSFASEDSRKLELEDYLVTKDVLDNIRGTRNQKDTAGERSMFTFAFGLTTPELDHLNTFDSMEQSPDQGDVVEAFANCRGGIYCPKAGTKPCPLEDRIKAKLIEAGSPLDACNIVHRIRTQTCAGCHHYSNGDDQLGVDCPESLSEYGFCSGEGHDRRGIWPKTLRRGRWRIQSRERK